MVKIIFPHAIKYKGKYISSNTAFQAEDSDVKALLAAGGKLIEADKKPVPEGKKDQKK